MEKFSIWAAKMKAPSTPMRGTLRSSRSDRTFFAEKAPKTGGGRPHRAADGGGEHGVSHVHSVFPPVAASCRVAF